MFDAIPRRHVVAGMAAIGLSGLLPRVRAAETGSSEQPGRPLAERLAAYAGGLSYDDLDDATIERVKSHVIDTIGCGIAAFDERPVRICRDVALAPAGGAASVIGTDRRTTPDLATFANGTAFRYYDLNDVYVGRFAGHPSDHIAACLAVAEAERASAEELIIAIALAYEVNCRLIDALDIGARGGRPLSPIAAMPATTWRRGMASDMSVSFPRPDQVGLNMARTIQGWSGRQKQQGRIARECGATNYCCASCIAGTLLAWRQFGFIFSTASAKRSAVRCMSTPKGNRLMEWRSPLL